jgi:hypothetical protein
MRRQARARSFPDRLAPLTLLVLQAATGLGAQRAPTVAASPGDGPRRATTAGGDACLDAIPASALRAVPVFLHLDAPAGTDSAVRSQLLLLAQEIARGVRLRTGGTDASVALPPHEPAWRSFRRLGLSLLVTPDSVRVVRDTAFDATARALVAPATDSVVGEGGVFFWPERSPRLARRVPILLSVPAFDSTGRAIDAGDGIAPGFPVFAIRHPWWTPAMALPDGVKVTYPESARRMGADGGVRMRFVVDEAGRAAPGSVRDLPPDRLPRYTREEREAYDAFVGAVRQGIERGRFAPLTYAGCPVSREVEQFFQFGINR